MKKALIIVGILALIVWVISWFRVPAAVQTASARPWPGGLGPLEAAEARYPARSANDAARKLAALAAGLPNVEDYVGREIARGELAIDEPPQLPDVAPIRELLLREPIVWKRHGGVGDIGDKDTVANRVVQMTVARALVASALVKGRANDAAGWEDLHAVWNLASSLDGEPQVMTQTAGLSMVRMINAVAWKMPLPTPPWLGELQRRDDLRLLLAAYQAQTASYWDDTARLFPTKWLANAVEHDRAIAEALFHETRCDVTHPMNELGTDLSSFWHRAFRYRAEREATANALRVREGKAIEPTSRCSDGGWAFDGTTLRFTHDIATSAQDRAMPLVLRVKR